MLQFNLLKNHAGIVLTADYYTLKGLHQVLSDINERSPVIRNKEGLFIALAFDIRKAYEGERKVYKSSTMMPHHDGRFGVEILWPVLLLQSRMLRASMAFIDTDKNTQAHAYALEAVIESALKSDFGADLGETLIERWMSIDPAHPWAEEQLDSRGAYFCSLTKAQRKKQMDGILFSFNPMYSSVVEHWIKSGHKDMPLPEEMDGWEGMEWPDPRW